MRGGWHISYTVLIGLALSTCGVADAVKNSTTAEVLGLGPDIPCEIDRYEARRMIGAYLRVPEGATGGHTFGVTGKPRPRSAPLPKNLVIDDSTIRRLSVGEEGALSGWRKSEATPIEALNTTGILPQAYNLAYRIERVNYSGPLVVGLSPTQTELPLQGLTTLQGAVSLTYSTTNADGLPATTEATGQFKGRIGYGSGRVTFQADTFEATSGPALPFDTLEWTLLGLCGAQVFSSGQGSVTLLDSEQQKIPVLGPGADPTAGRLVFHGALFANPERPGPPAGFGGVFTIQGDMTSLSGAFLTTTSG